MSDDSELEELKNSPFALSRLRVQPRPLDLQQPRPLDLQQPRPLDLQQPRPLDLQSSMFTNLGHWINTTVQRVHQPRPLD